MTTVRQSPRFSITRKFTRPRSSQRHCRKVFVAADVNEQSEKDSVDVDFCGEPFADHGELLSSLSPLLFSMKLFGLYFHREVRHRRRTDDPEWNSTTSEARTSSSVLRLYATIILILVWFNVVRFVSVFTRSDHFGAVLLMKIVFLSLFALIAIMYTAWYIASHTGKLLEVLTTTRITQDCVRGARRLGVVLTALCWTSTLADVFFGCYLIFNAGEYDYLFAPFVTYIKVSEDKMTIIKVVGYMTCVFIFPSVFFSHAMGLILVYVFRSQYKNIKKHFRNALGEQGQFYGDLSLFRRRHHLMSRAVAVRSTSPDSE